MRTYIVDPIQHNDRVCAVILYIYIYICIFFHFMTLTMYNPLLWYTTKRGHLLVLLQENSCVIGGQLCVFILVMRRLLRPIIR